MSFYHGFYKKQSYFEGWYFKHAAGGHTLALIPGVNARPDGRREAFIQLITDQGSFLCRYDAAQFYADSSRLYVRVGGCVFTDRGMQIDIARQGVRCSGRITYDPLYPPEHDVMGPFRFVPFMQCRHRVLSLGHGLHGSLRLNGRKYCFEGGAGYIESDRGVSFPRTYLWTQCSFGAVREACVMATAAHIPFLCGEFTGCTCIVCFGGKQVRLATYLGAKVIRFGPAGFLIRQGAYSLEARVDSPRPYRLYAPEQGVMRRKIDESVSCSVFYRFCKNGRPLFERRGPAGFEYAQSGDAE